MYHEMCQKLAKSITIWHFQSSNRAFLVLFAIQNTHFLLKRRCLGWKSTKAGIQKSQPMGNHHPYAGQSMPVGWESIAHRYGHFPTKAKVILSGALEQSPNTPSRDRWDSPCNENGSSDSNAPVPDVLPPLHHHNGRWLCRSPHR